VGAWQAASKASVGYFGPLWTWSDGACASWGVDTRGVYRGPFDRRTANPVLILNTVLDPATDISGALALFLSREVSPQDVTCQQDLGSRGGPGGPGRAPTRCSSQMVIIRRTAVPR